MYRKILVMMDGSKLAESVLPHVETIIKGCNVPEVVFVRVVESAGAPIAHMSSDIDASYREEEAAKVRETINQAHEKEASDYLTKMVAGLKFGGAVFSTKVIYGQVAETIAEYSKNNGFDLIVLSTHGRSGISRWIWGNTADRVLRSSCIPVFLVRAPGCAPGI